MVKKQQLAVHVHVGGLSLTSLFSSSNRKQNTSPSSSSSSSSSMLSSSSSYSAWQWASCAQCPRTLSFRQQQLEEKDVNNSLSTSASEADEAVVIRALRSDRLLYDDEPDAEDASCMLIKPKELLVIEDKKDNPTVMSLSSKVNADAAATTVAFGGATAMSVESQDPYRDFRESMEAMVMTQVVGEAEGEGGGGGVKDWRWLEDMLGWYLRANAKSTHGVIVAAFVDLLMALTSPAGAGAGAGAADYSSASASASPPATPAAANNNDRSASSSDCCSCCSCSSSSLL